MFRMVAIVQSAPKTILTSCQDFLRSICSRDVVSSILTGLVPEIFQRRKPTSHRAGSTAWLDGLRGWAALFVCLMHLSVYTHENLETCYGVELLPGYYNTSPAVWPFIRLFFSGGHFSVTIFFTISGYVLSKRLISLLNHGRRDDFIESLNSSICRRPGRLFLPVVWSTLALLLVWHITGIATPWPPRQPNIPTELISWFNDMMKFFYVFRDGAPWTYYNIHTWTIPVELKGSMMVYIWLFAVHQCNARVRILLTLSMLIYHVILTPGAMYACFIAGMFTAELDAFCEDEQNILLDLPWDACTKWLRKHRIPRTILLHTMLIGALYLGGQPTAENVWKEDILEPCRGWQTLSWLIPSVYNEKPNVHRWFWLFWASWLLLISCKEIHWARRFLDNRFSQYLGRNSFALYLIHGPMIGLFSERLFYLTGVKFATDLEQLIRFGYLTNRWRQSNWWPFPSNGPLGFEPEFLICVVISLPVFLYVAELSTKMFDTPSVKVAKWGYGKLKALQ